jgi:hypothetical protein
LACCLILCSSLAGLGCAAFPSREDKSVDWRAGRYWVSMIELIGNPERYHGKQVIVRGFLCLDFENSSLYLHRDDYENRIGKNAIALSGEAIPELAKWAMKYVTVEGTFQAVPRSDRFAWSGVIDLRRGGHGDVVRDAGTK